MLFSTFIIKSSFVTGEFVEVLIKHAYKLFLFVAGYPVNHRLTTSNYNVVRQCDVRS